MTNVETVCEQHCQMSTSPCLARLPRDPVPAHLRSDPELGVASGCMDTPENFFSATSPNPQSCRTYWEYPPPGGVPRGSYRSVQSIPNPILYFHVGLITVQWQRRASAVTSSPSTPHLNDIAYIRATGVTVCLVNESVRKHWIT